MSQYQCSEHSQQWCEKCRTCLEAQENNVLAEYRRQWMEGAGVKLIRELRAALKVVEKMKHHKDTWHDPGIGCLAECRYVCEALDEYNKTCGDK